MFSWSILIQLASFRRMMKINFIIIYTVMNGTSVSRYAVCFIVYKFCQLNKKSISRSLKILISLMYNVDMLFREIDFSTLQSAAPCLCLPKQPGITNSLKILQNKYFPIFMLMMKTFQILTKGHNFVLMID